MGNAKELGFQKLIMKRKENYLDSMFIPVLNSEGHMCEWDDTAGTAAFTVSRIEVTQIAWTTKICAAAYRKKIKMFLYVM